MTNLMFTIILIFLMAFNSTNSADLIIKHLCSPDPKEKAKAYDEVLSIHKEAMRLQLTRSLLIKNLINIINGREAADKSFRGTFHLAIKALGEMRAEESIPALVAHLDFLPGPLYIKEIQSTQSYYPVVQALLNIGKPAVPPLESLICNAAESDRKKRLAAYVLMHVLGKEKAIGRLQAIEDQNPSSLLKNSEKLSEYIRNFKPTYYHPLEKRLDNSVPEAKHQKQ